MDLCWCEINLDRGINDLDGYPGIRVLKKPEILRIP
jgi:hypothetical protein